MGIYIKIKGMKMPKSCADCDCWSICWNSKPAYNMCKSVCPLVSVPAHGRLIDADALIRDNGLREIPEYHEVVLAAPTIIEAEEGET